MGLARYEFIRNQLIQSLPAEDRLLFSEHERAEEDLASLAETEEDFFYSYMHDSPAASTARKFSLPEKVVYEHVQFIEKLMHDRILECLESPLLLEAERDNFLFKTAAANNTRCFFVDVSSFSRKNLLRKDEL